MNGTEDVAIVVIGRNEGDRLAESLRAASGRAGLLVYVDSGSSDGSVARAADIADIVHPLDPARPFSAARARNEGFQIVASRAPHVRFVQFVDGDCTLAPGWIVAGRAELVGDPGLGIVVGPLTELHPDASRYNRLCALEWGSPTGDIINHGALGGIMMARIDLLQRLGGFDTAMVAGEDSELGVRATLSGATVRKIAQPMAEHDADIHRFGTWWRRSVRAGEAIGDRYARNGRSPLADCAREVKSTLFWGVGVPAATLLLLWPTGGASLLLLGGYGLLGLKMHRHFRATGLSARDAGLATRFGLLAKLANGLGLIRHGLRRLREGDRRGTLRAAG